MKARWSILYRGPLSSCNYKCDYCPFAKTVNTARELADDRDKLARFVAWVKTRDETISILFTPWGEALHHRHYQRAMCQLSHMDQVARVAIQTNLAAGLDWVNQANKQSIAFWTTYHPGQVTRQRFLQRISRLHTSGIPFSVGLVGLKHHFEEIRALRDCLPNDIYLWVNAYKRDPDYYSASEIDLLTKIDPLFGWNNRYHPSLGAACFAGETSFTVDGNGSAHRCHFISEPIGNIYEAGFASGLKPRPCSQESCGCHIGYIHLKELDQHRLYGEGLMERIPIAENIASYARPVSTRASD